MKAVIMAGGKGTRLRPLTCQLPKPMVPLLSRPCMEYIIELLKEHGIREIAVTMQYLPDVIRSHFGDGSDFGVKLHYFEETVPLGTAGSVKNAQPFLDERFLVISGDALTDFDLGKAAAFHESNGSLATIVLTRVPHPLEYGVVMTDEAGRIVRFLEKPSWGEVFSDTVNTGIYILEPEVLDLIGPGEEYDFSNQLFPTLLADRKPLFGYVSSGYWSDIGNLQQYRQTQFDMLDGHVKVHIRGKEVAPRVFVGDNVTLGPGVTWKGPAFIGDHCVLDEGVDVGEYSILGSKNRLGRGAAVTRSILWDHNHIAEKNELFGSTICSGITCREASHLAEGSVVGSHCRIGPKSRIEANVKIWPNKQLRENSRLHSSFIWGDLKSKALFQTNGVSGTPNEEMTPEFAARFSTAYGATLAVGRTLAISSSPHAFSRMIKRIVTAGLQSSGADVIDLGDMLPAAARYAVRELSVAGGIHVQWTEGQAKALCSLECCDRDGLPLSKSVERKVENSYWQEDYSRVEATRLGTLAEAHDMTGRYLAELLREAGFADGTSVSDTSGKRRRVVLAAEPLLFDKIGPFWEKLHCEVLYVSDSLRSRDLTELVKQTRADFGVWIAPDSRSLRLTTDEGMEVDPVALTVLQYLSFFHNEKGQTLGVPVSAPHLIESLAEGLGGRVIRAKEAARSVMEVSPDVRFHPLYDALFSIALIVRNLDRGGVPLSQLLALIPSVYLRREQVDCPWDAKGKVMRLMMEQAKRTNVDIVDGIKFYHDDGWVLLLPDTDEPVFKVIAQAERPELAEALVSRYKEQIEQYLQ